MNSGDSGVRGVQHLRFVRENRVWNVFDLRVLGNVDVVTLVVLLCVFSTSRSGRSRRAAFSRSGAGGVVSIDCFVSRWGGIAVCGFIVFIARRRVLKSAVRLLMMR